MRGKRKRGALEGRRLQRRCGRLQKGKQQRRRLQKLRLQTEGGWKQRGQQKLWWRVPRGAQGMASHARGPWPIPASIQTGAGQAFEQLLVWTRVQRRVGGHEPARGPYLQASKPEQDGHDAHGRGCWYGRGFRGGVVGINQRMAMALKVRQSVRGRGCGFIGAGGTHVRFFQRHRGVTFIAYMGGRWARCSLPLLTK
eukprot:1159130-Pelagomonas_calceolata.AAC.8